MGQRHQIFIHALNDEHNDVKSVKLKPKYIEGFGNAHTTVYAFHYQWLYGLAPLLVTQNVLKYFPHKKTHLNPFSENFKYNDPRHEVINWLMAFRELSDGPEVFGYDKPFLLNLTDHSVRHEFDRVDNNDGITIIDMMTGKYCFMRLEETDDSGSGNTPFQPINANEYFFKYYPDLKEKHKEIFERAIPVLNFFDKVAVLTKEEVAEIFPKMKSKLKITQKEETLSS